MMTRLQIKEMRNNIESNGFFVERFDFSTDSIVITHLKDPTEKELKVYVDDRCPECNCHLAFDESAGTCLCLNNDCIYENELLTPPKPMFDEDEQVEYRHIVLSCKPNDHRYMNIVISEILEIIDNWPEVNLEHIGDPVDPESTLGLSEN